ncbi:MAG: phosphoheptose isomerase [Candidatus Schekmanbacteria bacterium]|nr:phosphoheptose isomerase [Candidatus Schekmanbacteria bacterium]
MTDLIKRLWAKDPGLWSEDKKEQNAVANRLGWLDGVDFLEKNLGLLNALAAEVKKQHFSQTVLLGMGGSSLCPYLFSTIFGSAPKYPQLMVLDSTDPDYIRQIHARINISQTLFILASKSGVTIEPDSLFKYFYTCLQEKKLHPADHFLAITDPDTDLHKMAQQQDFAYIFTNPANIGGRYSALTFFGLIPAALIGVNLKLILESVQSMRKACQSSVEAENPAWELARYLMDCLSQGRNKLTLLTDSSLTPFALWLEQLIAESTGKKGAGIIPIVAEPVGNVKEYGNDRCFVSITMTGQDDKHRHDFIQQLSANNFPVKEYLLPNLYSLAGEFLRWEIATALCGHFMEINPFDEPDVAASKYNTRRILEHFTTYGKMPGEISGRKSGFSWHYSDQLRQPVKDSQVNDLLAGLNKLLTGIPQNGYFALLAYLPHSFDVEEKAGKIRELIRKKTGCATLFGFGPRYLHSSGQLFKGGPDNGVFLILSRGEGCASPSDKEGLEIPGEPYNFDQLQYAQALGDFQALDDLGRPAIHLGVGKDYLSALTRLLDLIEQALM